MAGLLVVVTLLVEVNSVICSLKHSPNVTLPHDKHNSTNIIPYSGKFDEELILAV